MTRSVKLWAFVALLFVGGCSKPEFKEFNTPIGRYKVLLPSKPKEENKPVGEIILHIASIQEKNGAYQVGYADLPISASDSEDDNDVRLDTVRKDSLRNINATLTKETKIKLGRHPGRDVEADLPNKIGSIRMKIFIVGNRVYQVMSVGTVSWVYSDDTAKFLDSFALIE